VSGEDQDECSKQRCDRVDDCLGDAAAFEVLIHLQGKGGIGGKAAAETGTEGGTPPPLRGFVVARVEQNSDEDYRANVINEQRSPRKTLLREG